MDFDEHLKTQLARHEGERLRMYRDSKGIWTIGIGHNIEERGISPEVSALMFKQDIQLSINESKSFSWFRDLNEPRQAVIIDMIFNMGLGRFRGFKKTIGFLKNRLYESASIEMLDSKWARDDVQPSRSNSLSEQMKTGEWQ